jgi:hypothetical protein
MKLRTQFLVLASGAIAAAAMEAAVPDEPKLPPST